VLSSDAEALVKRVRSLWPEWTAAAAAAFAAWVVGGEALLFGFPIDDAWIHMVYGLSLRDEGALAYNTGIPSTGATSPLWAMVAMLAHVVVGAHGPSMAAAATLKSVSVLFHAVSSGLAASLARASTLRRRHRATAALVAGLVTATTPASAFAAVSGMEVTLASALMLATLLAATRGRTVLAGLAAGCATLARPECVLAAPLAIVLGSTLASSRVGRRRRALWASLAAALPVAAVIARNVAVSARPLPATFYAKAGGYSKLGSLARGAEVFRVVMSGAHVPVALLVVAGLATGGWATWRAIGPRGGKRAKRVLSPRLAMLITLATGAAYVGAESLVIRMKVPDSFYYQRYLLPAIPLLLTGAVAAALSSIDMPRLAPGPGAVPRPRWSRRWIAVAASIAALYFFGQNLRGWSGARKQYADHVLTIDSVQVAVGRALNAELAPDATVWVVDAGAARYWGRRRTVDLMRLNTPDLIREGRVRKQWWADAIVVVPLVFRVDAAPGLLNVMFVARVEGDPLPVDRSVGALVVLRCAEGTAPDTDTKVVVSAGSTMLAVGRCARR
jgi:hypothetical protein